MTNRRGFVAIWILLKRTPNTDSDIPKRCPNVDNTMNSPGLRLNGVLVLSQRVGVLDLSQRVGRTAHFVIRVGWLVV